MTERPLSSPRGFRQPRCTACALSEPLCICRLWVPLSSPIDFSVVMPRSEARSASNSARLLALWLPQTQLHVHGAPDAPREPSALIARAGTAVLFPGGSVSAALPQAIQHLIIPDGTWSQARRIERRWFAPHALPRLSLDAHWPSAYGLRRGRSGLCTFEAAVIALGLLQDAALAQTLLHRFAEWAKRARWLRDGGPRPDTRAAPADLALHPAAEHWRASEVVRLGGLATPSSAADRNSQPSAHREQRAEDDEPSGK
jgi:DTW domain-containing protein